MMPRACVAHVQIVFAYPCPTVAEDRQGRAGRVEERGLTGEGGEEGMGRVGGGGKGRGAGKNRAKKGAEKWGEKG